MDDIKRFLDYLFDDGDAFEVCLIGANGKHALLDNQFIGKSIVAGWFDDKAKAAEIIRRADQEVKPTAIYTTLNPCNPALLGRASNRLAPVKTRTTDKEIPRVANILIDIDPVRPAGVSATAEEVEIAKQLARQVYQELRTRGWPHGMSCESGNGFHLIYKIEDGDPDLTKGFLQGLSGRFSTPQTGIDTTVYNPARLVKIAGTHARKGDNIPSRPHRQARITHYPSRQPVDIMFLAPWAPAPTEPIRRGSYDSAPLDVPGYLSRYGIPMAGEKRHNSSTMYLLERCVFDESHTGKESAIVQGDDGKLSYFCFHNSCQGKTWHDARQIISGSDPLSAVSAVSARSSSVSSLSAFCQQSVSKKSAPPKEEIYQEVKQFVLDSTGPISTRDIDHEFCLWDREQKNLRAAVLRNLKNQGLVEKHPTKQGQWRVVKQDIELMDLFGPTADPLPLPLPLGLSDMVKIYPKSIIMIAGSSNAGKSAMAAGIAHAMHNAPGNPAKQMAPLMAPDRDEVETWYFNSEASAEELRDRWIKYPGGLDSWRKVKPVFRTRDFQDVIKPNAVNIIDYLEVYDNFWEIGGWIKDIFDRLEQGVAIILIQKKTGNSMGRGGDITMEKSRLYLALENNYPFGQICRVVKAKSLVDPQRNPNGLEIDLDFWEGWDLRPKSGWRLVDEKERASCNAEYRMDSSQGLYAFDFKLVGGGIASITREEFEDLQSQYVAINVPAVLQQVSRKRLQPDGWMNQVHEALRKATSKADR